MKDYKKMSAGEMYCAMGMDAEKWTAVFYQINPDCNVDKETMFGWFANAIMAGHDNGQPINGDHLQFMKDSEV